MTELDEALRALEKKWRGLTEVRLTWERGGAAELEGCADELAALLTTRQEVAPVDKNCLAAAKAALLEIETYLEEREDVIDGDYGVPAPNREMTMLRWVREVLAFLAMADVKNDVFEACKTWPEDIRKKLSVHELRRMGGWAPRTKVGDWRIDTSAGGPILVYQDCSVIESEQARYVLGLIERDATPTGQTSDARDGVSLIAAERRRQVEAEGWSAQHDDEHDDGELAAAATCYAYAASLDSNHRQNFIPPRSPPLSWPWEDQWFKPAKGDAPADRIRDLMKAGALIAAEIDRLQRAAMQEAGK